MHPKPPRAAVPPVLAVLVALAAVWVVGSIAAPAGQAGAQDAEAQALQLERQLMCPRCINVRLDHCELAICNDMRAEIREQLAAGRGGDDILLFFSDRFGDVVLAELPREGFNLVLFGWVGASVLLVAVLGAGTLWRLRRSATLAVAGGASLDAAEERWLDDQLREAGEDRG